MRPSSALAVSSAAPGRHRRPSRPGAGKWIVDLDRPEIALVAPAPTDRVHPLVDDRCRQVLAQRRHRRVPLPHVAERIVDQRHARVVADAAHDDQVTTGDDQRVRRSTQR